MRHYKIDIERAERNIKKYGDKCKTLDELARKLGVSRKSLYNWERNGIIKLSWEYKENKNSVIYWEWYYSASDVLNQLRK